MGGDRLLESKLDITFSLRNSNLFVDQSPIWLNGILRTFQGLGESVFSPSFLNFWGKKGGV